MKKITRYIFILMLATMIFICGIFMGNKITHKPYIYSKLYTDNKTGVQYIVIISKSGDIAIFPRLNSNGTLHIKSKSNFIFVENDIKGDLNEQTNFNGNQ